MWCDKTKQFLQKLKDSGHWNNDYDYSKVVYVNSKTKVIVIDKRFETTHMIIPNSMLKGSIPNDRNILVNYSLEDYKNIIKPLSLNKQSDYYNAYKNGLLPKGFVRNPDRTFKNDGWISWGDFLNTGRIADKNKKFLSFIEALDFLSNKNITNYLEYKKFLIDNKITNLPFTPHNKYKNDGWISWAHFLNIKQKNFLSFEEAKKELIQYQFNSAKYFKKWHKKNNIENIPYTPQTHYEEWISWYDFLGKKEGFVRGEYISFSEAKQKMYEYNIRSEKEFRDFTKTKEFNLLNIPVSPSSTYKEWISSYDFFNTKPDWDGKYITFKEARNFVRLLNLKTQAEWKDYCICGKKPHNIPSNPNTVYKNEFISLGDWLGTGKISTQNIEYLLFEEARKYIQTLKLKSKEEYENWWDKNRPEKIPKVPRLIYKKDGWLSMGDFLGYVGNGQHPWNKNLLINFIKSLQHELENLPSVQLITIINSNNLAKKIKEFGRLEDLVSSVGGTQERQNIVNDIINIIEQQDEDEKIETILETTSEFEDKFIVSDVLEITEETTEELKPFNPIQELHIYDNKMLTASLDDENIDFLIKDQLNDIWNKVLNNKIDINEFKNETGGERFTIIKNWFFDEYEQVTKIQSPSDYIFKYQPNLMQRLITYRLIKEKRYGNWSGTGAGKTLSAIFAGRYNSAKNTLIICNNATVEGWVNSIHEYFTNNKVYTKIKLESTDQMLYTIVDKYNIRFNGENNYFVINYETFQQEDGEYVVSELLKNNTIDYIILDEVQNVKQRENDEESTRRNIVNKLVIHASEKNDDLLIMVMSATPVINNLTEPKN
jgi:hypothetical protein